MSSAKIIFLLYVCQSTLLFSGSAEIQNYIKNIEEKNSISYDEIINTRAAYIPPMCYSKTRDASKSKTFNSCYVCHTKGKRPNYNNDSQLQIVYNFPKQAMKNPFTNLFKERSKEIALISDDTIVKYIQRSNYFTTHGDITLSQNLPKTWKGYRPDCYYTFDSEGFDKDLGGEYTGWRAYRYYPFWGSFWPTNGSMDDVIIRLDKVFRQNKNHHFDKEIYKLNLSIVEAIVKQKEIKLITSIDEHVYKVDLNANGKLDNACFISSSVRSYVGLAKQYLQDKKLHLALGLFPKNTEFLHSVRYLDWDDKQGKVSLSKRMKELRYAQKIKWMSYGEIQRVSQAEWLESKVLDSDASKLTLFRGNYEEGLDNGRGWKYQGFIEDKTGELRPQTREETLFCMGCHSTLGATTDSSFSFARKFKGMDKDTLTYGWNHWSQKGLKGVKEAQVTYEKYGTKYAYAFYLQNTYAASSFRNNDEVQERFFESNGTRKKAMLDHLHEDISLLLLPSKKRALKLNKAYKRVVEEQSYIYGRESNWKVIENSYKKIKEGVRTGIKEVIIKP